MRRAARCGSSLDFAFADRARCLSSGRGETFRKGIGMDLTRRDLGKIALAAWPAAKLAAKPNSLFGGVQVGANVPYSFHNMSGTADKILEYMTQLNLSAAELRLQPVEAYLGAPGVYASSFDAPGAGRRGRRACRRRRPRAPHAGAAGCAGRNSQEAFRLAPLAFHGQD